MTTSPSSTTTTTTKMRLKLLVDTKAERLLFAEASKDFIDFLFNLNRLPIGTVTKLLTKTNMVGSLGKIYESIENLSNTYLLHQNQDKDILLKPKTPIPPSFLLLSNYEATIEEEDYEPPKLYMCRNRCTYSVSMVLNTPCSRCYSSTMNTPVIYEGEKAMDVKSYSGEEGGFVKDVVTYMVMDDLTVQPMSTISCIALLNKFDIKDVSSLQELVVEFGIQEGIELLKASLQCTNVLTSVFHTNIRFMKESNMTLQ